MGRTSIRDLLLHREELNVADTHHRRAKKKSGHRRQDGTRRDLRGRTLGYAAFTALRSIGLRNL